MRIILLPLVAALLFSACHENNENVTGDRAPYIIPDSLLHTLTIDSVRQGELINSISLTGAVDFNQDKQVNIFHQSRPTCGNVHDVDVQFQAITSQPVKHWPLSVVVKWRVTAIT